MSMPFYFRLSPLTGKVHAITRKKPPNPYSVFLSNLLTMFLYIYHFVNCFPDLSNLIKDYF